MPRRRSFMGSMGSMGSAFRSQRHAGRGTSKGIEAVVDFGSQEEWKQWRRANRYVIDPAVKDYCLAWIKQHGIIDPWNDRRIKGRELKIDASNLRESLTAFGVNSRGRAVLSSIRDLAANDTRFSGENLSVYAPEALSEFARRLSHRYQNFVGSEYLPTEEQRRRFGSVRHEDLAALSFKDGTFELVVANDVFEHVPYLDVVLGEIARILAPHGRLIATVPFRLKYQETLQCAVLEKSGDITHLRTPEYHGDPVDSDGALVFQVPGWDILDRLKRAGFQDAYLTFYSSMRFGVLGAGTNGVLVLNAKKRLDAGGGVVRRKWHVRDTGIRALACLMGLPRSGTTVATAAIEAHSCVHAVYEPWNAASRRGSEPSDELDLDGFLSNFQVNTGDNEMLLVKETCTKPAYSRSIDHLLDSLPRQFGRYFICIMRNPFHAYLSNIEAGQKWWGLEREISGESFERWSRKSIQSLVTLVQLIQKHRGLVYSYDAFVHDPRRIISHIMSQFELSFEAEQLDYHTTVNTAKVAGDMNVARDPRPIAVDSFEARTRELAKIEPAIRSARHYSTVVAIGEWCHEFMKNGFACYSDESIKELAALLSRAELK